MQRYPMTVFGAQQLKDELARLKSVERSKVIKAIAEARSHGDLSENAEYDAAKNLQGFIEGRIAEIEQKLAQAHIIDPATIENNGKITFGAKVALLELEANIEVCYQIVGDDEANVNLAKISVNSPVARGLIGKEMGDIVEVKVPNGIKEYEILRFSI